MIFRKKLQRKFRREFKENSMLDLKNNFVYNNSTFAWLAELVDAPGSGPGEHLLMRVQVSCRVLFYKTTVKCNYNCN